MKKISVKCPIYQYLLDKTEIKLKEGNLLRCNSCNHLLSIYTKLQLKKSLNTWASLAHIFASSLVGNVLVSGLTPYLRI